MQCLCLTRCTVSALRLRQFLRVTRNESWTFCVQISNQHFRISLQKFVSFHAAVTFFTVKGKVPPRTGCEDPEGEYRNISTISLTSALDGGVWLTPRPGRFPPGKKPGTHWNWSWVGPRAGLDTWGKPHRQRDSIPWPPAGSHLYRVSIQALILDCITRFNFRSFCVSTGKNKVWRICALLASTVDKINLLWREKSRAAATCNRHTRLVLRMCDGSFT